MVSIIICSITPEKFGWVSANFNAILGAVPHEIIGIHDATSLSEGYNRGIAQSHGEIVIFCHDDIEILTPDFDAVLRRHLQTFDVVGCVGTNCVIDSAWIVAGDPFIHGAVAYPAAEIWPSERFDLAVWGGVQSIVVSDIQAMDGFFFAVKRRVLDVLRFDEKNFDGFHVYDTDFTFGAHLAGFKLAVCKDILIAHQSGGNFGAEYQTYSARFAEKHQGRLASQARNKYKLAMARNLDRAQILRMLKPPATVRT